MRRYRVVKTPDGWPKGLPFRVGWEGHDTDYGVGDEFEREFTPEEEWDNLHSGLLEIVPRKYRVIGDSTVHDTRKDDEDPTFEEPLLIEQEKWLVESGHVEVVEEKPKTKTSKKKEAKT